MTKCSNGEKSILGFSSPLRLQEYRQGDKMNVRYLPNSSLVQRLTQKFVEILIAKQRTINYCTARFKACLHKLSQGSVRFSGGTFTKIKKLFAIRST